MPAQYARRALQAMQDLKRSSIPIPDRCKVIWFNLLDVQVSFSVLQYHLWYGFGVTSSDPSVTKISGEGASPVDPSARPHPTRKHRVSLRPL